MGRDGTGVRRARGCVFAAALMFMAAGAYGQFLIGGYGLQVGAGLQFSTVTMEETVFTASGSDQKDSFLAYEAPLQTGARFSARVEPYDRYRGIGFSLAGSYTCYLPSNTGSMKDEDWEKGKRFSVSEHDLSLLSFQEAGAVAQCFIPFVGRVAVGAGAAVYWNRTAAAVRNGWIQGVTPGMLLTGNEPKKYFTGVVSEYFQEWVWVVPAASVWFRLGNHELGAQAEFWGKAWGNHLDYHFLRQYAYEDSVTHKEIYLDDSYTLYRDEVAGDGVFAVEVLWKYRLNAHMAWEMRVGWQRVLGARGDTAVAAQGMDKMEIKEADMAGGAFKKFNFSVGVNVWI